MSVIYRVSTRLITRISLYITSDVRYLIVVLNLDDNEFDEELIENLQMNPR